MIKSKKKLADCRLPTAYLPILLMAIMLFLTHTIELHPTIRYVSHTGSSTPPYTSWETAADSIQKAIDICEPGDTVLVANGVYYENLVINTQISLIGLSMDSTIIDGTGLSDSTIFFDESNSMIENFNIYGSGTGYALAVRNIPVEIKNCRVSRAGYGIASIGADIIANNLFLTNLRRGLGLFGNGNNIVTNCVILLDQENSTGISIGFAPNGIYNINNNIIIFNRQLINFIGQGIYLGYPKKAYINNNLISGFSNNIFVDGVTDSIFIKNNTLLYQYSMSSNPASILSLGYYVFVQNVSNTKNKKAIHGDARVKSNYNLYWANDLDLVGLSYGDSDLVADPMFVKDTLPNPKLDFDFQLQAYSPAIDTGNPDILDIDGSRSDIGMYGGPLGESYKYKDLAPRPPRNLSAIVDSSQILVIWNRNTEADTSHYNVYRDTVANFTIDSTKLISSQTDTFYIQYPPYQSSQYVYKITCIDNQGNESFPSKELVINITSLTTNDYPMTVNDYLLYQNYPNPFNPTTTIAYKLKERAYVKLMIYDIKGELISVLVNKEQESGYYEVEFNVGNGLPSVPNNLASGIYLYRIEITGDGKIPVYTDMKKMVLLK